MIRGKFRVANISTFGNGTANVKFSAQLPDDRDAALDKETLYHNGAPQGSITLSVNRPEVAAEFKLGQLYYLTLEEAPQDTRGPRKPLSSESHPVMTPGRAIPRKKKGLEPTEEEVVNGTPDPSVASA